MIDTVKNTGVSTTIGVILFVAITVSLIGLVTFNLYEITPDKDFESSDISVELTKTENGVKATTVQSSKNVKSLKLRSPTGSEVNLDLDAGDSATIGDGSGQYSLIGVKSNGNEVVLDKTQIDKGSVSADARTSTFEQEGLVEVNPPINGATVKSVEDGVTLDVVQTNENGRFTVGASEQGYIIVKVQGFTKPSKGINNPLYASAKIPVNKGSNLNIDFDKSSAETVSVDGEDKLVSYNSDKDGEKQIGTSEQLKLINETENGLSEDYEIVDDINFSESENMTEIGSENDEFTGTIDGNGHSINNMTIENESENESVGFINNSDGGTIKNVTFDNPELKGNSTTGLIVNKTGDTEVSNVTVKDGMYNSSSDEDDPIGTVVGKDEGDGEISNVTVENTTINASKNNNVGGITGEGDSTINNSSFEGSVDGNNSVGGLIGSGDGEINNSSSSGTIKGTKDVGGLIGSGDGIINNSSSSSDVDSDGDNTGGLIGGGDGAIDNSSSSGSIDSDGDNTGGLIGSGDRDIDNSTSSSDINANGNSIGGLIGNGNGDVNNSSYTGDITVTGNDVGGLMGTANGFIRDSNVESNITVNGGDVGGVVGDGTVTIYRTEYVGYLDSTEGNVGGLAGNLLGGDINESSAEAEITAEGKYIGGLIGDADDGYLSNSYYKGNISNSGDYVGGLIGGGYRDSIKINKSFVETESIKSEGDKVGGIIGGANINTDSGKIKDVYVIGGVIEGNSEVGGIIGENGHNITNSYVSTRVNSLTGDSSVGLLIGKNGGDATIENKGEDGTIEKSYWDSSVSSSDAIGVKGGNSKNGNSGGASNIDKISGVSTNGMTGSSASDNMVELDFNNIWDTVNGDYPDIKR